MNTPLPASRIARPAFQSRAFTLIELLTVIAIIGILAAIIIPVVSSVRQKARKTQCSSNLRQVASAYLMYMADNRDRLPTTPTSTPRYDPAYVNKGHSRYLGAPADNLHAIAEISPVLAGQSGFQERFQDPTRKGYYRSTSYWPNPHVWRVTLLSTNLRIEGEVGGEIIGKVSPSRTPMLAPVSADWLMTSTTGNAPGVHLWAWSPERFEAYGGNSTAFAYFDGHVATITVSDVAAKWAPAN